MTSSRIVRRAAVALVLCGSVVVFGRVHAAEVKSVARHLGDADPVALAAGAVLSIAGMANRGALNHAAQRAVGLRSEWPAVARTAAAAFAAQKLVKPASVAGVAVFVADGRRRGHRSATVTAACALAALGAMVALAALLVLTCCLLAVTGRLTGWWLLAAALFACYAAGVGAVCAASCRPGRAARRMWGAVARLPRCSSIRSSCTDGPPPAVIDAVTTARRRPAQLVRVVAHAVASKVLGVGMLMAGVAAAGVQLDATDVVLAYATAMAASTVSLLPGGVGAVEASTVALLVSAGAPLAGAVLAVAVFRVFDLWLPVLTGAVVARSVTRRRGHDERRQVFWAVMPPSTGMTAPVRYDAAGSTTDSVIWATSSGSP